MKPVIVIPAYQPDERLVKLVEDLKETPFPEEYGTPEILVADDGSRPECGVHFEACKNAGCTVIAHEKNRGKGAALKTAYKYILENFGEDVSVITADADGQHLPADIARVARDMLENPDALVLGSRTFGKGTPWKSLAGNRITSFVFLLSCGRRCPDTQTGLRGIPASLLPLSMQTEGDRYEYEMNFLMDAAAVAPFVTTSIETVYYDGNTGSHFHPVRDAARVYSRYIRYAISSGTGFVVDFIMFLFFMWLFGKTGMADEGQAVGALPASFSRLLGRVFISTVLARICSGLVNFLMNKYYSFRSKGSAGGELPRYIILFIAQMCASALFTSLLAHITGLAAVSKIVVDFFLFFISYRIQKQWVFSTK